MTQIPTIWIIAGGSMTFDFTIALHIELYSSSTSTLNLVSFLRDWLAGELLSRLAGGIYRCRYSLSCRTNSLIQKGLLLP
jgi:hypothetical protein